MIASFAMCLRYSFNMIAEADRLEKAISEVLDNGLRTGDIMSDGCTKVSTSEMGDAVETPGGRHLVDGERHLVGPGHPEDLQVAVFSTMLPQAAQCPFDQGLHDEVVESRCNDCDARVADDQVALGCLYLFHPLLQPSDVFGDLEVEARDRVHLLGC